MAAVSMAGASFLLVAQQESFLAGLRFGNTLQPPITVSIRDLLAQKDVEIAGLGLYSYLLFSTGWRTHEAVALKRVEADLVRRTATLGDSKTGRSMRPLSHAICDQLRGLPPTENGNVFPASRGGPDTLLHIKKFFPRIARLGGLPDDVTPHVLRHSFISLAADLGYSEATIAALVGHKGRSVTSRYVHAADAVLLAAADTIADRTAELMGEAKSGAAAVVPLRGAR